MKRLLSYVCMAAMAASLLAGCGGSTSSTDTEATSAAGSSTTTTEATTGGISSSDIKVGIIYIGDENEGYSESHMTGVAKACEELGIDTSTQLIQKTNIAEDESSLDAAEDLVSQGCNVVFATSFGHESYLMQAAMDHPEVQFCHATGYQAASSGLSNFHNYFDNIYEARYVSGIAAGMKLKEMIDNGTITADKAKMGYVGAYPYAEVISGFTSFYLGAKSIVPEVTMKVLYTNSWADPALEGETAKQLIADGCVLISQHADTTGAPTVCEAENTPCVGYNVSMLSVAPNTALTSPTNKWAAYYTYAIKCVMDGVAIDTDWSKGFADDAVEITELGTACAEGTEEKVKEAEEAIKAGTLHVFDTSTFTVDGAELTSTKDLDGYNGVEYIADGYFHESEYASAPAFATIIDGIDAKTN